VRDVGDVDLPLCEVAHRSEPHHVVADIRVVRVFEERDPAFGGTCSSRLRFSRSRSSLIPASMIGSCEEIMGLTTHTRWQSRGYNLMGGGWIDTPANANHCSGSVPPVGRIVVCQIFR
jgi:hypothetical protein